MQTGKRVFYEDGFQFSSPLDLKELVDQKGIDSCPCDPSDFAALMLRFGSIKMSKSESGNISNQEKTQINRLMGYSRLPSTVPLQSVIIST